MRLGRLGFAGLVTALMGCATAESITDEEEGIGGSPIGGTTGSGGKGDGFGGTGNAGGGGAAGDSGSGGAPSGGTSAGGTSAGGTSTGGTSAGGTSASGGTGGSSCASGKKMCGGVCISPNPIVGCGLDASCTGCPNPPANATSACSGTLCDFTCNAGFTKSGANACVSTGGGGGGGAPSGGGGSSGAGGGGSCPAPCNPSDITSQFLCTFYCATQTGKPGLCLPLANCCTCPA